MGGVASGCEARAAEVDAPVGQLVAALKSGASLGDAAGGAAFRDDPSAFTVALGAAWNAGWIAEMNAGEAS